jgi:hypothetical protein
MVDGLVSRNAQAVFAGRDGLSLVAVEAAIYRASAPGAQWAITDYDGDPVVSFCGRGDAIYAATGEDLLLSTDGGETFEVLVAAASRRIRKVVACTPDQAYLASEDRGLLRVDRP